MTTQYAISNNNYRISDSSSTSLVPNFEAEIFGLASDTADGWMKVKFLHLASASLTGNEYID